MYTAAVSEISTSMSIEVNNQQISSMNYSSIGDPILVSGDFYSGDLMVSNPNISVDLNYNMDFLVFYKFQQYLSDQSQYPYFLILIGLY